MKPFYIARGPGEAEGPIEESELHRRLQSGEMSGEELICQEDDETWVPAGSRLQILSHSTTVYVQAPPAPPEKNPGGGAVLGGWICVGSGIVAAALPLPTFYFYLPLLLAAFALSIVAMAMKRVGQGIGLMASCIVGGPLAVLVGWILMASGVASTLKAASEVRQERRASMGDYKTNLVVYEVETRKAKDLLDGEVQGVFGKLKNDGTNVVLSAIVTAYFLQSDGKPVSEASYSAVSPLKDPLKPGYIAPFGFKAKDIPSEWSGKIKVEVTSVRLDAY